MYLTPKNPKKDSFYPQKQVFRAPTVLGKKKGTAGNFFRKNHFYDAFYLFFTGVFDGNLKTHIFFERQEKVARQLLRDGAAAN